MLLQRNAVLPWFIVFPRTDLQDVLDLPTGELHAVLADCAAVSRFIKQHLGYPKVNFAGLGNVLPDMHLHVIGRRTGDSCWPMPVWGNLSAQESYSPETLREWQAHLQAGFGLQPCSE